MTMIMVTCADSVNRSGVSSPQPGNDILLLVQKNFWNLQDFDEGANKWSNQLTRTAGVATIERLDVPADFFIPLCFSAGRVAFPLPPPRRSFSRRQNRKSSYCQRFPGGK